MNIDIDALLTQAGEAYRAAHPEPSPEETAHQAREGLRRLEDRFLARLDAADESACEFCLTRRPRTPGETPLYPADTCTNADKPWHNQPATN